MSKKGFTLIELLLVVSIIGILSGVLIPVINPKQQRKRALDAVKLANVEKLAQGIESYCVSEGSCPVESDGTQGNGDTGDTMSANSTLSIYLKDWPSEEDADYIYTNGSNGNFSIHIEKSATSGQFIKYSTAWSKIRDDCTVVTGYDTCTP